MNTWDPGFGAGAGDFATNYVMSSEFREESNDSIFSWFDETLDSATDYVSETTDNPSKPLTDVRGGAFDDAKEIDPKDFKELVNYAKANGVEPL